MQAFARETGARILGYRLLDGIDDGRVYLAEPVDPEAKRAAPGLAVVRIARGLSDAQVRSALVHAERALQLRHPAIASVLAAGPIEQGAVAVVTEYVKGVRLDEWTDQAGIGALASTTDLVYRVCRALHAAHRLGVAHHALHPRNFIVCGDPTSQRPGLDARLLDLGTSSFMHRCPPDLHAAQFIAPERLDALLASGASQPPPPSQLDVRADVYSAGCLLFYLCSGGAPYSCRTVDELVAAQRQSAPVPPSRINPGVPPALDAVALCALARRPEERYGSMSELATALMRVAIGPSASGVRSLQLDFEPSVGGFDERPTSEHQLVSSTSPPPPPLSSPPRTEPPVRGSAAEHGQDEPVTLPPPPARSVDGEVDHTPLTLPSLGGDPLEPRGFSGSSASNAPLVPPAPAGLMAEPVELPVALRRGARGALPLAAALLGALAVCAVVMGALRLWSSAPSGERAATSPPAGGGAVTAAAASEATADPAQPSVAIEPASEGADEDPGAKPGVAASAAAERQPSAQPVRPEPKQVVHRRRAPRRGKVGDRVEARPGPAVVAAAEPVDPPAGADEEAGDQVESDGLGAGPWMPPPAAADSEPESAPASDEPTEQVEARAASPAAKAPRPEVSERPAAPRKPVVSPPPTPARPPRMRIVGFDVRGSLTTSAVRRGLDRVRKRLAACFAKAAPRLAPGARDEVRVEVEIDVRGRARGAKARGSDLPGVDSCVSSVVGRIVSTDVPDTGTARASWKITFGP